MSIEKTFRGGPSGQDGKKTEISFREYYADKYPQCPIGSHNQPLLMVHEGDKKGKRAQFLIPELCLMTGIPERAKALLPRICCAYCRAPLVFSHATQLGFRSTPGHCHQHVSAAQLTLR